MAEKTGISGYEEVSSLTGQNLSHTFLLLAELGLRNVAYEDPDHLSPPEWVPDSCCAKCCSCNTQFTFSNRRVCVQNIHQCKKLKLTFFFFFFFFWKQHHCRSCGFVFCQTCSSKKLVLPQFGFSKPVRVCSTCHKNSVVEAQNL